MEGDDKCRLEAVAQGERGDRKNRKAEPNGSAGKRPHGRADDGNRDHPYRLAHF